MSRRKGRKSRRRLLLILFLLLLVATGGAVIGGEFYSREAIAERQFARAEKLLAEKKYADASGAFREIYQLYPNHHLAPRSLFTSGEIKHLYLESPEKALLDFLLVEKTYPDSDFRETAQRRIAALYMERLEDFERAVVAYQKLLDEGVADADGIQYRIGEAYFKLNNFEQARIEWETLLKRSPESALLPEALYRIGVTWSLEKDYQAAEETFLQVMDAYPQSPYAPEARFSLAAIYEEQERLAAALDLLETLQGEYLSQKALDKKMEQVRERMTRKKKAI